MAQVNTKTSLQCPNCNFISTIIRVKGKRGEDHLKNYHCPNCKSYHKHREIPRIDHYRYDKANKQLVVINRFKDKRKEELNIVVNKTHWENWLNFELKAFNEELLITTDYNLFETLLLNYINSEDFRSEVDRMDAVVWKMSDPNSTIMNVRVSRMVLNEFKAVCSDNNKSDLDTIYNIMEFTRDGSYRLE